MGIGIGDLAKRIVREGQYGSLASLGQLTDQPSIDIINSINSRMAPIWGRGDWKWTNEAISIVLVPLQRTYNVGTVSGNLIDRIKDIIPYDPTNTFLQGAPLKEHTARDFYQYVAQPRWDGNSVGGPASYNQGYPSDYYIVGLVNGVWSIQVDPVPITAGKLGGFAKSLRTIYTTADIIANTAIAYFPNDVVIDPLFYGCMIDIGLIRQILTATTSIPAEQTFKRKIDQLWSDQSEVATDNTPPTTRLPNTVVRLRRRGRRSW